MMRVRVSSHQSPVIKLGDSQIKLTPNFRFSTAAAILPSSPEPLIPGLPDDVSLNCLLRLPVSTHSVGRLVCRGWHRLFSYKEHFFSRRKLMGFRSPWLFTLAYHRFTGNIQWQVLDLTHLSWHPIPAMPCKGRACLRGFRCLSIPAGDGTFMVCGGFGTDTVCALHFVLKYDIYKNRWAVMSRMLADRSFFAGGVIDGRVYVAGGYNAEQYEMNSAEVLDADDGSWHPIASMGANMCCFDSAVLAGRLYVTEGCVWPFISSPRGQVFDPKTGKWEKMAVGMREGWSGQSAVVDDQLFVISEYEMRRVKLYNMDSDSWSQVEGAPMPERIRRPFSVSCSGNKIIVVGQGLHVAIGHLQRQVSGCPATTSAAEKPRYSIRWQNVDGPPEFSDLAPSNSLVLYA